MQKETVYIKLEKDVEVQTDDVYLKDLGKIYCENDCIVNKCKTLKVTKVPQKGENKKVISVMKVIELITKEFPNVDIQNIGEADTLVERVEVLTSKGWKQTLKIIFVCLVSFFGTCFSIMAFHNDIGIDKMFSKFYEIVFGEEMLGCRVLEISYSIGLAIGITVFFNHIGGRRITKDPTPIEVEMRVYEKDVNDSLIETADREGKKIDIS